MSDYEATRASVFLPDAAQSPMSYEEREAVARISALLAGEMTDAEIEAHILDCGAHMQVAYERFEQTGCPHDRDEACMWLYLEQQAISARRPLVVAEMERERGLGGCYFLDQGAADRVRMLEGSL